MILHHTSALGYTPKRIVSLVPSQTELLHYLGLEQETLGITKFCIHPDTWYHTKSRVGGTKQIRKAAIDRLQPDLVIANKEENVKEQVEALAADYPVWVSEVNDLEGALQMIQDIGVLTAKDHEAAILIEEIKKRFGTLRFELKNKAQKIKTAYLIWKDPYMAAGGDNFINDMLNICGFENIFADKHRYPEITVAELRAQHCELVLLSSEPYPFSQKHLEALQELLPGTKIVLADGAYFSWYGSRLLESPQYFRELIASIG
jgi:ABC-type Fe3+-hydroxamate transport system substrate-binding protein